MAEAVRFLLLGMSNESRVLMVVHCERGDDAEELRIISARKATKNEQQYYRGGSSSRKNMTCQK